MRKILNLKNIFSGLVLIALLAIFALYINTHFSEFQQIKFAAPENLSYLFILGLIFLINNGLVLKYLLLPFKIDLPIKEWFGLSVVTTMSNYLAPFRGGAVLRAVYLKKRHQFSFAYFLSTLSGLYVITFFVNSLVGLITTLLIYQFYSIFSPIVFVAFLIIFLSTSSIIIFSPKISKTKYTLINKILNVINGWHMIKSNIRILLFTVLVTFLNLLIFLLMVKIEFAVFGIEISFLKSLFIAVVSTLSLFISITPGALGIKEAIMSLSSILVGATAAQALSVALLDRVVFLALIFILGPIFSYYLMKKKV